MRPILVLLACALLLAGCGGGSPGDGRLVVVATTTQAGDLVRQVGGDRADVRQILRPNSDPHDYEPRPSDVKALSEASLIVRSGGEVDDWLDGLVDDAGSDAPVLDLSERVRTRREHGDLDPHWWQDPRNAELAVAAIRDRLAAADPGGADAYRRSAARYLRRLGRLDRRTAACIERIPPRRRKLVTTHDALGYYAARYGLEVVGAVLPALSTQAQPSARDVEALVDQIRRTGVRAIYPESSINPKLEQAVARESGAEVGGALWADSLGPEGSSGDTYVKSIESNTRAIAAGLSGGAVSCPGA
ncbi:MAG: zinc ABC transporter substrate-binding protein [Thermoleophilaceae bacterium]|nr:zinc ABC transporter substrate-binding protein [Thermoleophilaceae bacterium]